MLRSTWLKWLKYCCRSHLYCHYSLRICSLLYLIIWQKLNIKIFSTFCLPDWLNLVAACIYLVSVFTYPYQLDPLFINYSEWFVVARRLDFIASVIDFIAIFLWVKQFYEYYQREYNSDPSSCIGKQINIWIMIDFYILIFQDVDLHWMTLTYGD